MKRYNSNYKLVPGTNYCKRILSDPIKRYTCKSLLEVMDVQRGVIACTNNGQYYVGFSISNAVKILFENNKKGAKYQLTPITLESLTK